MNCNGEEFFDERNLETIPAEVFQEALEESDGILYLAERLQNRFFEWGMDGQEFTTENENYIVLVKKKPRIAKPNKIGKL